MKRFYYIIFAILFMVFITLILSMPYANSGKKSGGENRETTQVERDVE